MQRYLAQLKTQPVRIFVAAAGAGAGIQQILWDPNFGGSSKIFAGAAFPYSKEASVDFLGYEPKNFVCLDEAVDLAISAYIKADNGDPTKQFIGLGLTAAVATTVQHRGEHRVHAVVITKDRVLASEVILPKEGEHGRRRDGLIADTLGMELIIAAARLIPETDEWAYLDATNGKCLRDITLQAREHFFRRPLFTRFGKRMEAPTGSVTLCPGNFNPPHEGHFVNTDEGSLFQITANPLHKSALSLSEMLGRVRHFQGRRDLLFLEGEQLYLDKARRFPGSTIILGTDALVRMLDPKWGVETVPLLMEFQDLGIRFKVGLRGTDTFDEMPIPAEFRHMFTPLPRTKYADLSSTQLRAAG